MIARDVKKVEFEGEELRAILKALYFYGKPRDPRPDLYGGLVWPQRTERMILAWELHNKLQEILGK